MDAYPPRINPFQHRGAGVEARRDKAQRHASQQHSHDGGMAELIQAFANAGATRCARPCHAVPGLFPDKLPGAIELTVDGKRYVGRWTAATEGAVGFGTLLSGSRMATGSSVAVGGSRGLALLRSTEGGTLRCEFVYSGMSGAGFGACQDNTGKTFDLMIG